jgi:DNA-binding NtrC family response regulator
MTLLKTDNPYNSQSILLVDDDRLVLSTLTSGLARTGFIVYSVESVTEAEAWLEENVRPDLVILDVRMPGRSGLELTKCLHELDKIPFILLTAYSEQEIIAQATESGAMGYLVKPIDIPQLIPTIETALSRSRDLQMLRSDKDCRRYYYGSKRY